MIFTIIEGDLYGSPFLFPYAERFSDGGRRRWDDSTFSVTLKYLVRNPTIPEFLSQKNFKKIFDYPLQIKNNVLSLQCKPIKQDRIMYYNGQNLNLREYVSKRHEEWNGNEDCWNDEGLVWAIQDYYGSMGEFSEEDKIFLKENGFTEEDFTE